MKEQDLILYQKVINGIKIQYNDIVGYVFEDYVDEISAGSSSTTYDVIYTGTVYDAAPNFKSKKWSFFRFINYRICVR